MVIIIYMQNFSLLTLVIPDLGRFKAQNLYRVSQSELLNASRIVIAYVKRLKFCGLLLPFKNFCFYPRKLLTNWRNPSPHIAVAPADHGGHEIKNCFKLKINVIWTRKLTLSFELTILELFDGFTSLRVASCLSTAHKRLPNEMGNKYCKLYTYFRLA